MHGLKGIANANVAQTIRALENLKAKAHAAKAQNHPQTASITAQYESLRDEVLPELTKLGYTEPN